MDKHKKKDYLNIYYDLATKDMNRESRQLSKFLFRFLNIRAITIFTYLEKHTSCTPNHKIPKPLEYRNQEEL